MNKAKIPTFRKLGVSLRKSEKNEKSFSSREGQIYCAKGALAFCPSPIS